MNALLLRLCHSLLLVLSSVHFVVEADTSVTVDDSAVSLPGWKVFKAPFTWQGVDVGSLVYQGTVQSSPDQAITFAFTGTGVSYRGLIWDAGGNFTATVDGNQIGGTVNTFTPRPQDVQSKILWSASDLSNGDHTLVITKEPDTTDWAPPNPTDKKSYLYVDAFIVTRPDATTAAPTPTPTPSSNSPPPASSDSASVSAQRSDSSSQNPSNTPSQSSSSGASVPHNPSSSSLPSSSAADTRGSGGGGGSSDNSLSSSSSNSSSGSSVGGIVGGVLGAALVVLLLLAAFLCRRRRLRRLDKYAVNDQYSVTLPVTASDKAGPYSYPPSDPAISTNTSLQPPLVTTLAAAQAGHVQFGAKGQAHTWNAPSQTLTDSTAPSSYPSDVKIRPLPTVPGNTELLSPTSPTATNISSQYTEMHTRSPSDGSTQPSTRYPSTRYTGTASGSGSALRQDVEDLRAQVEALRAVALAGGQPSIGTSSSHARYQRPISEELVDVGPPIPPTQADLDAINSRVGRIIGGDLEAVEPPPRYTYRGREI